MDQQSIELFPCELDDPASQFAAFAREFIARIHPSATSLLATPLTTRTSAEYEFDQVVDAYGDASCGFQVVRRSDYYEGGGWAGTRESVRLSCYGLPDGASISLAFSDHTLLCAVSAPEGECGITIAACRNRFDVPPPVDRLGSLVIEARSALRHGNTARAIQFADGVLRHRPQDADALLVLGSAAGAEGDLELAIAALELLIELDPAHVDGLYNLGNIHFERFQWASAEHCFRAALAAGGPNHAVHYQLARALERQDQLDEAAAEYRAAIAASPNPGGIWGFSGMDFTDDARGRVDAIDG